MICFLLVSLLLTIRFISCAVDLTLEEGASGSLVVLSSIAKINDVFPLPDQQLLRRIAYVETRDGLDSDTYSNTSNNGGGIWQLSFGRFKETKTNISSTILNDIQEKLQINWTSTSWYDLRKPLYSALAARLYFEVSNISFAVLLPVADQAIYWAYNYTSSEGTITDYETAAEFLRDTNEVCGYSSTVDLMFLLDSSVSVSADNFEIMKQFVHDVVDELTIGPDDVQVGVYAYSHIVTDVFNLTMYSNKAEVLSAISAIEYRRGLTFTDLGLQAILDRGFVDARPASQGVPRVLVVITDGESNRPDLTIEAANGLHNAGVIVFAVGIASASIDELNIIASKPSNAYFYPTFEGIYSLQEQLSQEICTVSPTLQNDVMFTVHPNESIHGNYPLNGIGITIKLLREGGSSCTLYGSTLEENPNQVIYEIKITTAGSVEYVEKYVSDNDPIVPDANTLYVTVECEGSNSNITLTVDDGDTTTKPVIVVVVPASSVNAYYGESFTVTCYATGRPAPDVTWYNPNGALITSSTDGVSVVEITTSLSILAVSDLSTNDEGLYTCAGINTLSNGIIYTDTATVNVTGKQDICILDLEGDLINDTTVLLTWSLPRSIVNITYYEVNYTGHTFTQNGYAQHGPTTRVVHPIGGMNSLEITDLYQGYIYGFKMGINHDTGVTETDTVVVMTPAPPMETPIAGSPAILVAEFIDNSSINLTWDHPSDDIIEYQVIYIGQTASKRDGPYEIIVNSTQVTIRGLINDYYYEFKIRGRNEYGYSGNSSILVLMPPSTGTATGTATDTPMNVAVSDGCDHEDRCDRVLLALVILIPAILIILIMIIIMYCYLRHSSCQRSTYGDSDSDEVKSKETVAKKTSKFEFDLDEMQDKGPNEDLAVPYPLTENTYESMEEPRATIPTYNDVVELHTVSTNDDKKLEQPVQLQPATIELESKVLESKESKAFNIPKDDPKPIVSGVLFLPEPFTLTIDHDRFTFDEKANDNIDTIDGDKTTLQAPIGDYEQGGQFEVNDTIDTSLMDQLMPMMDEEIKGYMNN